MSRRPRDRERRMERLLHDLASAPPGPRSASEIGASTDLGDTALPLLADLARRGWLEPTWAERDGRRQLCYCLTESGHDAVKRDRD